MSQTDIHSPSYRNEPVLILKGKSVKIIREIALFKNIKCAYAES